MSLLPTPGDRQPFAFVGNASPGSHPLHRGSAPQTPDKYHAVNHTPRTEAYAPYGLDTGVDNYSLMNISVVVYGLVGVICQKSAPKRKASFGRRMKDLNSSTTDQQSLADGFANPAKSGVHTTAGDAPTTAVVSYQKSVNGSQQTVESFLPSIPLNEPTRWSLEKKHRYAASWPSEQLSIHQDESALERSSFKIVRCMKQGVFVPGGGITNSYVHETFTLRLNLSRGTELIRLGTATIVITGEEEGEVRMNIPAKAFEMEEKKTNMKKLKSQRKANKKGYFSNDLTKRYYLDENASLSVGVKVIPQDTIKLAEDRQRKEHHLRQMLGSDQMILNQQENVMQPPGAISGSRQQQPGGKKQSPAFHLDLAGAHENKAKQQPSSAFQQIFCGGLFCAGTSTGQTAGLVQDVPVEILANAGIAQMGIESLISSVSESTDGMTEDSASEDGKKQENRQFHMFAR